MKYEIVGGSLPVLKVILDTEEEIFTDKGDMIWRQEGIEMKTNTNGGIFKGLARTFAGENMFLNNFKALENNQEIAFAPCMPGTIKAIELNGSNNLIAQKNCFMAAQKGVNLDVVFTKKFSAGLLGGEGFVLQKIHGNGTAFLEIDGYLEEKELQEGESLLVDQGNVAYFEDTVKYEIITVKGLKNKFFGGEGFFLVKLTGKGKIGLQSIPKSTLGTALSPYISVKNN